MTCRYCGAECEARVGQPGYVNVCPECLEAHPPEEPERWMAGQSADPDGLEWEMVRARAWHGMARATVGAFTGASAGQTPVALATRLNNGFRTLEMRGR